MSLEKVHDTQVTVGMGLRKCLCLDDRHVCTNTGSTTARSGAVA